MFDVSYGMTSPGASVGLMFQRHQFECQVSAQQMSHLVERLHLAQIVRPQRVHDRVTACGLGCSRHIGEEWIESILVRARPRSLLTRQHYPVHRGQRHFLRRQLERCRRIQRAIDLVHLILVVVPHRGSS